MMHEPCVTADLPVKTNGHSLCVNCTDVCRLLGLKQGDKVRVTFEQVPPSVLLSKELDDQILGYGHAFVMGDDVVPADQVGFVYEGEEEDEKWKVSE